MNNSPEIFVRTADLANFKSVIPRGEAKVFAQIEGYLELMRQQKKEPRSIAVFRSSMSAMLRAINKGLDDDRKFEALTYKGIPLEASNG